MLFCILDFGVLIFNLCACLCVCLCVWCAYGVCVCVVRVWCVCGCVLGVVLSGVAGSSEERCVGKVCHYRGSVYP